MLKKNEKMEYIEAEEGNLVVFDPDTQDTHFLDEIGADILNCLEKASTQEEVIEQLAGMYDAPPEVIRADVEPFLKELIEKKVVVEK